MRDDAVYLTHILDCIRRVETNTAGGREEFYGSETLQDAVLRNLQVMCESTQMLSDAFKTAHREADWRRIADFRNRLVHDYLGVDLDLVWKIVTHDVPELKRVISGPL